MEYEKLDNTTIIGIDPAAPGADRTQILNIGCHDMTSSTRGPEGPAITAGNRSITTGGRMTGLRSAGVALAAMSASMMGAGATASEFGQALTLLHAKQKKRARRNAARTQVTNEYSNNLRKIKKAIGARQVRKERKKFNRMLKAHNESQSGQIADRVIVDGVEGAKA